MFVFIGLFRFCTANKSPTLKTPITGEVVRRTDRAIFNQDKGSKHEYDENVHQINERDKCVMCDSLCKLFKHLHTFLLYFNYERLVETENIALE